MRHMCTILLASHCQQIWSSAQRAERTGVNVVNFAGWLCIKKASAFVKTLGHLATTIAAD